MHLESFIAFLTHPPLRLGVTWASDSRSISTPSLPLNGIWQLRVSALSVGLHIKSTLNTFVVQLYPHRVIFTGLSKTILVMASYDSGHPSSESYWAWVVPSESPYCSPKGDFTMVLHEPNCSLKGPWRIKARERFTYCSRPWRMKEREMSYLEPYYSRPWRIKARERFTYYSRPWCMKAREMSYLEPYYSRP